MPSRAECDVKGQTVRLIDVFALGPFMIWFGVKAQGVRPAARGLMVLSGAATILFNGANYLRLRNQTKLR